MRKLSVALLLFATVTTTSAKDKFQSNELSINGFRNPSIGLEYRYHHVSVHSGYYVTNFESNITTEFIKTGVSYWFAPIGQKEHPSSFYGSLSFAGGTSREYRGNLAFISEVGFRWMVVKGLNLRIGVAGLAAAGKSFKVNPTPGISYSFFF
jgi:hypothetical protein